MSVKLRDGNLDGLAVLPKGDALGRQSPERDGE